MLGGDHRRGLRQRQRQIPQLGRHHTSASRIREAGPLGKERQRLVLGEYVHRHARTQVRHRQMVAGDDHPGRPGRGDERLYQLGIRGVIEHHKAAVPVDLQPTPHRPGRTLRIRLAHT